MDAGALDCCHGPTERDIWQNAWFPKPPASVSTDSSRSIVSSQSTETCTKPSWQSFLWIKMPPQCSVSAAAKSWTGNRRISPLYTLLTCEAAHFMERLCIGGEVCDIWIITVVYIFLDQRLLKYNLSFKKTDFEFVYYRQHRSADRCKQQIWPPWNCQKILCDLLSILSTRFYLIVTVSFVKTIRTSNKIEIMICLQACCGLEVNYCVAQ